jgi:hypothetical protein
LSGGVTVAAAECEESDANKMKASRNWHRTIFERSAREGNEGKVTTLLLIAAFQKRYQTDKKLSSWL